LSKENEFPTEEMTYALRGAFFEVRNELKAGWSEHVYHHALERFKINNRVLLHVCALSGPPSTYEFARLKTTLASLDLPFALLVNFGFRQLQIFGVMQ